MKIGVIGLGLIGGSIFKRIYMDKKYDVVGISDDVRHDCVTSDFNALKACDVVFVCVPMNAALEVLEKIDEILDKTAIVTDVCSLKEFLTNRKYNYKFIPAHPMAGSEKQGFENSSSEMFEDAKWIFTPLENTASGDIKCLESVINDFGASVIFMSPQEHDRAVALISNLPLVVSQALCANIENDEFAKTLAASGFRDTTRLAMSNCEMANDMVNINHANIDIAIQSFKSSLDKLLETDYLQNAKRIKTFRKNLY
ncbi:prephenate dehydrogenase/arogenate dehydrogenase family protein [bacterium]|nr:prephenate dehydrogenase/arogenate dehydrogenase family protein [bacterium]